MHSRAIKWYEDMMLIRQCPYDQSVSLLLHHVETLLLAHDGPNRNISLPLVLQCGGSYIGPHLGKVSKQKS